MYKFSIQNMIWRAALLIASFVLAGCGGGGGKYFPPSIALNYKGITKTPFVDAKGENLEKILVEGFNKVDTSDDFFIKGERYYRSRNIKFNNYELRIAIPLANWVSIITSEGEIVAKLETPRYTRDAVAIELTDQEQEPFLAVLIEQQATSHSSTLYILDTSFRPIYKEHLLGAIWISKVKSPCGDQLLVHTEDKWRPEDQWVTIGGKWRYKIYCSP